MNILDLIKQGRNPQQALMTVLQNSANSNPIAANLLSLANKGDGTGIEQIARNMCQSQGKDFDKEFTAFKQMLGVK